MCACGLNDVFGWGGGWGGGKNWGVLCDGCEDAVAHAIIDPLLSLGHPTRMACDYLALDCYCS